MWESLVEKLPNNAITFVIYFIAALLFLLTLLLVFLAFTDAGNERLRKLVSLTVVENGFYWVPTQSNSSPIQVYCNGTDVPLYASFNRGNYGSSLRIKENEPIIGVDGNSSGWKVVFDGDKGTVFNGQATLRLLCAKQG